MLKFRTDLFYSLVAFESVLVAIAAILYFPVWVLAVAIAAFIFATAEMIASIVAMHKTSYNEEKGRNDYKFPVCWFVLYALMLTFLTATVILAIKMLFGFALITLALLFVGFLVIACIRKIKILRMIAMVVLAVLVVFLVSYGVAHLVHSGVNLNVGTATEGETTEEEGTNVEDTPTEQEGTTVEEIPTDEEDTTVDETPTDEEDTTVGETPTDEEDTTVGETPTDEEDTTVGETPTDEEDTTVGETPTDEEDTTVGETPTDEEDTTVGETPTDEEDTTVGETPTDEEDTTVGETPTDEEDTTVGETPTDEEDTTPEVEVKISAPDTMKYGEPVHVILEGANADNLKYGNSDFISIVKISDNEVVLTLVGIVNDAGQVEIVPASGYITVTDSVTGTNISIRIVE